jgi:hypothetical protein
VRVYHFDHCWIHRLAIGCFCLPHCFLVFPLYLRLPPNLLFLEATGIASGAWVLAGLHKKIAGFQIDEVYIGTAEERAAKGKGDNADDLYLGVGHMIKLPGFAENAPPALKLLFEKDESVRAYISSLHQAEDGNQAGVEESFRPTNNTKGVEVENTSVESSDA